MRIESIRSRLLAFFNRALPVRHFRRRIVADRMRADASLPQDIDDSLRRAAHASPQALFLQLDSRPDGLDQSAVDDRLRRYGSNDIGTEAPMPGWLRLWHCYTNPFNLLLTLLALVSWLTSDLKAATVIGSMVALSTGLRFIQEGRSHRAADQLKAMVGNTATVLRRQVDASTASLHEIPIAGLVPGDIVHLSAGDMVPADLRVLSAKDLFIAQAALTGESLPVEKFATAADADYGPLEWPDLCFMGTNVISGTATAIVLGTGRGSYFGALAERVTRADPEPTQFQAGVNRVSWVLIRFMLVMAPVVLLINGFTKGDWIEATLFALSVAVGLTPEMLPMIVTSTLAKGAVRMGRKKVIVKRLDAIQDFGAMDILCTDKTGTLTQDRIVLERYTDAAGTVDDTVLELAYLNSHFQTGLKNLLDVAVLEHAEIHHLLNPVLNYRKIDEIPFDFARRRMSVVVSERDDHHELICKGALDQILAVCSHVRRGATTEALTPAGLADIARVTDGWNAEGLRVVAVACKDLPPQRDSYSLADEAGLTLVGYIAFLDPPKETTAPALAMLAASGVTVKVLTGDNDLVALKVCHDVGLAVGGVLLGHEIDALDDQALTRRAAASTVFARLAPAHKERLVRVMRADGHVVGFLGDGINDAPALRAADVGISVDSAVDIAREAADLILLEKSLMVLGEGVLEGRRTFANMLKYIKMTASSNFGNVFSVLIASSLLPFLPMLPMHLLVQNLLYDIAQTTIPFDNVDEDSLRQPQQWKPDELPRFMLYFGPLSSVFDLATYALMWFVFHADSVGRQTLFQSGWFVEGLLSQTLIVHLIRTRRLPFLQSRASWPLLLMTALIAVIAIALPMSPVINSDFKLTALPLAYFPWLLALLLGYGLLVQGMKGIYARRYGWQ